MIKMERLKGTIVGFCFLIAALSLKSIYVGEYQFLFGLTLAFFIALGPSILSYLWTPQKAEISKK